LKYVKNRAHSKEFEMMIVELPKPG